METWTSVCIDDDDWGRSRTLAQADRSAGQFLNGDQHLQRDWNRSTADKNALNCLSLLRWTILWLLSEWSGWTIREKAPFGKQKGPLDHHHSLEERRWVECWNSRNNSHNKGERGAFDELGQNESGLADDAELEVFEVKHRNELTIKTVTNMSDVPYHSYFYC